MAERQRDLGRPPPPRWRVVERDRRLVVIDMRTGEAAAADTAAPASSWSPKQTQFDGSTELTTHSLYDAKGPRTIRLDPGSAATIGRLKMAAIGLAFTAIVIAITNIWLLLPLALFANGGARRAIRQAITAWLDRIEREAS